MTPARACVRPGAPIRSEAFEWFWPVFWDPNLIYVSRTLVNVYCYCCFLVLVEPFSLPFVKLLGFLEQIEFFPWPFAFISVCVSFTFGCVLQVPHCVISTSWIGQTMAIHTLHRNRLRVFQRLESWQVFMTVLVFRATLNDGGQKIKQLTMWNHKGKESPEAQCR